MDYEKKYKEALERARNYHKQLLDEDNPEWASEIEKIFPELAESEDEKIRKELISLVKNWDKGGIVSKYTSDANEIKLILAWLEKQGGIDNCPLESSTNIIMTDSKKNQVKTKFHEGQWIVQENIGVYKVIEVCESWYEVIDIEDNHYSISFDKEYMCHLWTIQDAKDGDVLAFDNEIIVIFKDLYNTTTFHSYCHVEESVFSVSKDDMPDWWEGKGFHPAIKEQHDTLFAKMKEAGYEWDTENKQLKKISQRMISAEAKEAMYSKPA